jgi:tRNA (guanine37-N1)-methyltransferase|tara:strand:- start:17950 stop:18603 length:654 start_codon:yes stop_codon:yes gene_type:complete
MTKKLNFHIITLFPKVFDDYTRESIIGRAKQKKKISISFYNPRDYTADKHKRVDRKPYGGGPGMVLEAIPILSAAKKAVGRKKGVKVIFLTPSGKQFTNTHARKWARQYKDIVLISGHYEGVDARVKKALKAEEISVGPYILTGGEIPAMIIVDSVTRQLPGVLGNVSSLEEKRVSSSDVYTRPEEIVYKKKKYRVPKVLFSGDHKKVEEWRRKFTK